MSLREDELVTEFPYPSAWDRGGLEAVGIAGFVTFGELRIPRHLELPKERGVYAVVRPGTTERALTKASLAEGGPYDVSDLAGRWIDNSPIVYIGKADAAKGGTHTRV